MIPNLRTEFQVTEMRRQETLAEAARYRAALSGLADGGKRHGSGALRQQFGSALIRVGQRFLGERSIESAGQAAGLPVPGPGGGREDGRRPKPVIAARTGSPRCPAS